MALATARSSDHSMFEPLEARALLAGDAVLEWNDVLLDAIRVARTAPPYAARDMAMVHVAVDDAVDKVVGKKGKGSAKTSAEAAVARAAYDVLVALYPAQKSTFRAALTESLGVVPDGPAENRGVAA